MEDIKGHIHCMLFASAQVWHHAAMLACQPSREAHILTAGPQHRHHGGADWAQDGHGPPQHTVHVREHHRMQPLPLQRRRGWDGRPWSPFREDSFRPKQRGRRGGWCICRQSFERNNTFESLAVISLFFGFLFILGGGGEVPPPPLFCYLKHNTWILLFYPKHKSCLGC